MAQGYYTLDEAANVLAMSVDDLKMMARKGELRSFQDRGTWRFRVQDIQELARQRGLGSEPDLVVGDSSHSPGMDDSDDDVVPIGQESKTPGQISPPGSDSDVRLVSGEGLPIGSQSESDVQLTGNQDATDVEHVSFDAEDGSHAPESGVRLGESAKPDSDVRMEGQTSDSYDKAVKTDEIDLDAELTDQSDASDEVKSPFELSHTNLTLPSTGSSNEGDSPKVDSSSDFELSVAGDSSSPIDSDDDAVDLGSLPAKGESGSSKSGISIDKPKDSGILLEQESEGSDEFEFSLSLDDQPAKKDDKGLESSGDFELSLDDSSAESPKLDESSSEFELTLDDDSSAESPSLDDSGSSSEFELTLDSEDSGISAGMGDSSSEFELTIDVDEEASQPTDLASDSEFELTLDDDLGSDSSEFELTLDEAGELSTDDSDAQLELSADDLDISLDDSASEVVALDDDESDFDISLDDSDIEIEDESSSQVVTIDDELADADDETIRQRQPVGGDLDDDFEEIEDIDDAWGEAATAPTGPAETIVVEKEIEPAPWGAMPVVFMLPCVVVLLLVGLMSMELLQSLSGYHEPGMLTKAVGNMVGMEFK